MFIDPPYDLAETELGHNLAALAPLLDPDALVIVERSSRSPEPVWGAGLASDRRKDYGDTTVWYAAPSRRSRSPRSSTRRIAPGSRIASS